MFLKRRPPPEWFSAFVDEIEAFARGLPANVRWEFERERDGDFWLTVEPPTEAHRRLVLGGNVHELEYALGKVWTERITPEPDVLNYFLAACDAVKLGRVREVRDRRTGVIWHLYRLTTRGQNCFARDSQYSLWHWLKLRVRNVQIHRLPPLSQVV